MNSDRKHSVFNSEFEGMLHHEFDGTNTEFSVFGVFSNPRIILDVGYKFQTQRSISSCKMLP